MEQDFKKLFVSEKYKYQQRSHIKLNREQKLVRNGIQKKIDGGIYRLEETNCLCGSKGEVIISETDRYGLSLNTVICKKCGLLRTNPRLDKNSLTEFYIKEYRDLYMESKEVEEGYFKNMIVRGREIIDLIRRYCKGIEFKNMDVLEIGCSAGGILIPFLEAGATVKGYDYDQRYLDYGHRFNQGLNLCFGGFENLETENKRYDLIIINHVLEHLLNPETALGLIKGNLKENGILYIGVPGLKNPEYYYSPTKSFMGSLHIGHIFHFTEASLIRLLKTFEVLYIDSKIRAIFKNNNKGPDLNLKLESEFSSNLEFIKKYEKSLTWKIKRLKIILENLSFFLRLILPLPVFNFLQTIYRKVKPV